MPVHVHQPKWAQELWRPHRYKVLYGGRGGGKSYIFADTLLLQGMQRAERILCCRESQSATKESVHHLLTQRIYALGLGGFYKVLENQIRGSNGTTFLYRGLNHNPPALKSTAHITKVWVEEAQAVTEESWQVLTPTIREENSEIWVSFNPGKRSDATSQRFLIHPPENAFIQRVTWRDNPWFPQTLNTERKEDKTKRPDTYAHIWEGDFESAGTLSLIPWLWIEAAVGLADRLNLDVTGRRYAALDVAGAEAGGDANALALRHGISLNALETWNGFDTAQTTQRAIRRAAEFGALDCYYDAIGVGEGITGEWAAMGRRGQRPAGQNWHPWNGAAAALNPDHPLEPGNPNSPKNKDQYENLKAQGWFALRGRFYEAFKATQGLPYDPDGIITLAPNLSNLTPLMRELAQPEQRVSKAGRSRVEKQPAGAPSPNLADAVMMAFWPCNSQAFDWSVMGG